MSCDKCRGLVVNQYEDVHCMSCGKRWFLPWPAESREARMDFWTGNYEYKGRVRARGVAHSLKIKAGMAEAKAQREREVEACDVE